MRWIWGMEEEDVLLPNSLRVSTWMLTEPDLDTNHQFSKTLTSQQREVHCQALANADSGRTVESPTGEFTSFSALPGTPFLT